MVVKYAYAENWFHSPAGASELDSLKSTADITDFFFGYLLSLRGDRETINDEDMYKIAFIMADSMLDSNQNYAGKQNILSLTLNPVAAYVKNLTRTIKGEHLCFELILVILGIADPFDSESWLYSGQKHGYSSTEYSLIASDNGCNIKSLFAMDFSGREDIRQIISQFVWIIGRSEFLSNLE